MGFSMQVAMQIKIWLCPCLCQGLMSLENVHSFPLQIYQMDLLLMSLGKQDRLVVFCVVARV